MKCLVVDDSKMSRMILKKIIGKAHPDWDVYEASDGQEAIEMAKNKQLDVVLLDYNMPIMNGGEAAKILRPQFPNIKMAFLTANMQAALEELAIQLKIDFIPKPITEEKILLYIK
ncbi:MAG: response regulator [Methylococcales bacterium]|nr:response regulator [Methylococcales bacterium]